MTIQKSISYLFSLTLLSALTAAPSLAQQRVDPNKLEKSHWYEAPKELQVIDTSPVIKDFRPAPAQAEQSVVIPPGPAGSGAPHIEHMGGVAPSPSLPKAGFGSNISSSPARALPAVTHGGLGHMAQPIMATQKARPSAPISSHSNGNSNAPVSTASYGGYGQGSGDGSGAAARTDTNVRGKLLGH